ncbi:MAG: hypothetical protein IPI11_00600 [Haliscomenobacter sp.]|nr:hypothetical protein [Haliscomenobacter sp.]
MAGVWFLGACLWGFGLLPAPAPSHALYLGLVEITHPEGEGESSLQIKVFYDDLQSGIRAGYPKAFQPSDPESWADKNKPLIQAYFRARLLVWVNRQAVSFHLQSVSLQQDAYFMQFRIKCPAEWDLLQVKADFLMELFPDQTNVVQAAHGKQKRFGRTTSANPGLEFPF